MGSLLTLIILAIVFGYPAIKTTIEDKRRAKYLEEEIRMEMLKGNNHMARIISDELARIKK